MAIDGPGIIESDLAHDVYNHILDQYDAGLSIKEISESLLDYEASLADELEAEIFLGATCKAYWEIGNLEAETFEKLCSLVKRGTSLALWAESGDEAQAQKRKLILSRFIRQLSKPKRTPRTRKKYAKIKARLFTLGDCVQLKTNELTYRGVVCDVTDYRGECTYSFLVVEPSTRSTAESFQSSCFYGRRIPSSVHPGGTVLGPHVIRPEHRMLLRAGNPFEVVGQVKLDPDKYILGSFGGVLDMGHVIADFEQTIHNASIWQRELLPLQMLLKESV